MKYLHYASMTMTTQKAIRDIHNANTHQTRNVPLKFSEGYNQVSR